MIWPEFLSPGLIRQHSFYSCESVLPHLQKRGIPELEARNGNQWYEDTSIPG